MMDDKVFSWDRTCAWKAFSSKNWGPFICSSEGVLNGRKGLMVDM